MISKAARRIFFVTCLLCTTHAVRADTPRSGAQIFQTYCANCHAGGWQGAPVANDKSEWQPRLEKGMEAIFKNAKQGLNGMPPMGTCMDCSDTELRASIKEMLPL